jgi:hypothetical protein
MADKIPAQPEVVKPDDANAKLIDKIDNLEKSGMEITRQWHSVWSEAMRYFFSEHDKGIRKHSDWEYVVLNYIWPTAMQEIAKLCKNNPKIIAIPWRNDDVDAAEVWQGACQWQWQSQLKMRLNQIAAIFCGKIFGYRVSKVYWENKLAWDNEQKQWSGDVQYKLWHPAMFWADGQENINDGNCGTVRWVTLEYAQGRWPQFKKEIEEISVSSKSTKFKDAYGLSRFRAVTATDGTRTEYDNEENATTPNKILSLIDGAGTVTEADTKWVCLSEVYFKDSEEKHTVNQQDIPPQQLVAAGTHSQDTLGSIVDNTTGQPVSPDAWPKQTVSEYDEPVYPNGRMVLSIGEGASRIILNPDPQEQIWQFSKWPFIVSPHYLLPFMWQGINAVTLYKSTQDMINTSVTHMVNNLKQFGDPRLAVEDGAIAVNPKTKKPWSISAAAGSIMRFVKGGISKYKIEPPVPLSPAALGLYELFSQEYKNITGLQAVAQGQQLKGGTTATEAQTLAISANDRIFLQSVYEDEWIKGVASMVAEMMQAYYDEGRWIRIIGGDNMAGIKQITGRERNIKFDIDVEAGTTLPFDEEKKVQKFKMAYDLFAQPVANPMMPNMLRALDIPGWQKLLAEFETYQDYLKLTQLVQGVKAGQIDPQQAMQMVMQRLIEIHGSSLVPNQGNPNENTNGTNAQN